jgi:hypothetical protein
MANYIPPTLERLGYSSADGSIVRGQHFEVISDAGATRTLVAQESGAICLNNRAAGIVWTLPAPITGMFFRFRTITSRSTNAYQVITGSSGVRLYGSVMAGDSVIATSGDVFTANGTTHRALTLDGDTKGGLIGESYEFLALNSLYWLVSGMVIGTGTMVDPFTDS